MDRTTQLRSQLDIMTKSQTEAMMVSTTSGGEMFFVFVVNFVFRFCPTEFVALMWLLFSNMDTH